MSIIIIIQAVHFTRAGKRLMRLGLAIAQRPYNYSTVPEIELQFFLNYVNSTNYSVSASHIHINIIVTYAIMSIGTCTNYDNDEFFYTGKINVYTNVSICGGRSHFYYCSSTISWSIYTTLKLY